LTYQAAGVEPLTTPLWTLIVEIKFYIGVAIFLLLIPRFFKNSLRIVVLIASWEVVIILIRENYSTIGASLIPYITLNGYSNLFALGICYKLLSQVTFKLNRENLLVFLISSYEVYQVFFTNDFVGILNLYMVIASIMILFSAKITLSHFLQKLHTGWGFLLT
jgi:peptidoglycan/LPS O-acetylase OafA/YrhL